jgi:hypothetical protein
VDVRFSGAARSPGVEPALEQASPARGELGQQLGVGGFLEYPRDINVIRGTTVHAVVVNVTVNDPDAAMAALEEQVVPSASGAPGFVSGYWVRLGENRGTSVVVFESEQAARAAAGQAQAPGDFVRFDSVEVGEVVASA